MKKQNYVSITTSRCVVSLIGMTSNLTLANPIVFNRSSVIRVHTENTFIGHQYKKNFRIKNHPILYKKCVACT